MKSAATRPCSKGWRFWVLENDLTRPFDIHTDRQYDQVLVYDSQIDLVSADDYWTEGDTIQSCSFRGRGILSACADPAGMVRAVKDTDGMIER